MDNNWRLDQMSKNKVFYGADKNAKKTVDKSTQDVVEFTEYKSSGKTAMSYTYVLNDERKAYDLLVTTINLATLESETVVEKLRVDSEARALMEVQKRYSEFLMKKKGRK